MFDSTIKKIIKIIRNIYIYIYIYLLHFPSNSPIFKHNIMNLKEKANNFKSDIL